MALRDSNDKIAELLKETCPPAAASPEFKAKLRLQVNQQAAALGAATPKPLWQQPFVWIPAAAACAMAAALIMFFVVFRSVPPTVIPSDATDIRSNAAMLSARLDNLGSDGSAEVSFEWGVTTDYGNETTPELRKVTGTFEAELTGLAPNTTYHFRVKAVGSHGTVYGPDMQFTTGPATLVTTNDATNIATTSATLNGDLTSLGTVRSVTVSFEWGPASGSYTHTTAGQTMTSTGVFSADLSGLSPGTTYYFTARADGGGDPVYGPEKSFATLTAPPSATTNDATGVATTSATLSGDLTSLGTAGSVTVSFEWGTASGSYAHTTADQAMTSTGAFSADLSGLSPGTTYYFRAKALGDGDPVYGEEESFTTSTTPPAARTRSATEVRCTSATLNGILDSLGTAESVEVSFEWGITTAYSSETTPQILTAAGSFNASLTGLSPRTTYHFRAKADGDGDPVYGDDIMFTTGSLPGEQRTWYLSANDNDIQQVMYDDNTTKPSGILQLSSWGLTSLIWRADQSSSDTEYPAGNWLFQLKLGDFEKSHTDNVEIGTWDGSVFTPYGVYVIHGLGDDEYTVSENISVGSFTVPSGGYVAVRITVTSSHQLLDIYVGGEDSFVRSPSYPPIVTTTAATGVEQTTAFLNGYLDNLGSAGSVTVYFEWGITTAYGSETTPQILTTAGSFSLALADLAPNTTYHFRAKVVGDGTNYGVDMTFTTLP